MLRAFIVSALFTLSTTSLAAPIGLKEWEHHHPEAARELGEWVKQHPEAAERFFEWDGHHPEGAKEFVMWSLSHPSENIDVFVLTHKGWKYFDAIMEHHRPAAEAFMGWARRHPEAAEALMFHPHGLEWAGHHLYKDYWQLKHPHRL